LTRRPCSEDQGLQLVSFRSPIGRCDAAVHCSLLSGSRVLGRVHVSLCFLIFALVTPPDSFFSAAGYSTWCCCASTCRFGESDQREACTIITFPFFSSSSSDTPPKLGFAVRKSAVVRPQSCWIASENSLSPAEELAFRGRPSFFLSTYSWYVYARVCGDTVT
jgi:hypothetical protein